MACTSRLERSSVRSSPNDPLTSSAWSHSGPDKDPEFHKEPLIFENVELTQRSYK